MQEVNLKARKTVFLKRKSQKKTKIERTIFNKTGTSQVGAIPKAQKAQNILFGKKT